MIKELLIKMIKEEIQKIEESRIEIQEPYIDGVIDGLDKAMMFVKKIFE